MSGFFERLPRPGQCWEIPGGRIWCESWDCTLSNENVRVSGQVRFGFEMDSDRYEQAMRVSDNIAQLEGGK
jgi:hypothetical protein